MRRSDFPKFQELSRRQSPSPDRSPWARRVEAMNSAKPARGAAQCADFHILQGLDLISGARVARGSEAAIPLLVLDDYAREPVIFILQRTIGEIMKTGTLIIAAFAALPALSHAAPPDLRSLADGATSPPAAIKDVAFLSGHWIGDGLGACSEELMAPAAGGQIMGMFRQMKPEGGLRFYEFYHIAEHEGSLVLRIKHFNPDLTGWEDKDARVEFPLVAIEGTTAYFDGLTFSRSGSKLNSAVAIEGQGVAEFVLRKAKKGEACS